MSEAEGVGRAKGPEGEIVRCGPTGRAQRIKTGGKQWSEAAEEKFFDILASCANVRMAARATGFTTFTVYRQRRIRPDFAARWQVALEQGYARLEMELVHAACRTMAGKDFDADRPIPTMTVEQAMNVLRAHRNAVAGDGRRGPGQPPRRRRFEEVRASIERKIAAIERVGAGS
ncbi:hypothetical protein [Sphingopyxis sp.]|uniref:hypothetical protein n=1 Tax=Sphingopyxis sp. TaxID=1908224 RepID=UPI002FC6677F